MQQKTLSHKSICYLIFFSGLAALSWEVVWQIKSSLALGVSAWGTSVTLGVTMGGMALGALLMGAFLKNFSSIRPIRTYGILEIIIGLSGLTLVSTFQIIENLDTWAYGTLGQDSIYIHLAGICVILGIPALCLGATLPVIGLMAQQSKTPLSALYGLNTLGAATGCLFAAFVFIPLLGIQNAIFVIASINIIVGLIALIIDPGLFKIERAQKVSYTSTTPTNNIPFLGALFIVFVTGFTTFVLEVAWFRSLTSAFLSTTDAFAIMLAAVLLALGLGAKLVPLLRAKNVSLGSIIGIAAVLVFLSTPIIERFDYVTHGAHANPVVLLMTWFGMTLYFVGLPILFLGVALPWVLDQQTSPKHWSILYGLNAFAAILGAVIATWILLPMMGFAKTAWCAGLILLVTALFCSRAKKRYLIGFVGMIALSVAVLFESGVGRDRVQGYFYNNLGRTPEKILAFDEGPNATLSVVGYDDGMELLAINGFVTTAQEGSTNSYHYMPWMGHLPMLLHPDPKKALVICFGTGQTANAVRKENPDKLDIVDINAQVYEFAPLFDANEGVLEDPRVNPIVMDGRAYIRRTQEIYDVITLEPMPPSFAGVNALYSKEFYEESYNKLSDDGIIAQWVPFHIIPVEASVSIAKTLQSVFPNSVMWVDPLSTTGILIGSKNPSVDIGSIIPGYSRHQTERTLSEEEVRAAIILDREDLEKYSALGQIIDDNNQLLAYGKLLHLAHITAMQNEDNHALLKKIIASE